MLKTIVFGYRDWALVIFNELRKNPAIEIIDVVSSFEEYSIKINDLPIDVDFLLFIGWSWIIPLDITNKYLCLGIHPSDLPRYRGGSPIQHQIISGILDTKVTLMTLSSEKLDAGDIWLKEDLDLRGDNMSEIFANISKSSIKLLNKFVDNYSMIKPQNQQIKEGSYFKRRKPEESRIPLNEINKWELKKLYNFIRSLTDPYPNAFIEDENGNKLIFKQVQYIENQNNIR